MHSLQFGQEADAQLTELKADRGRAPLLERINEALQSLATDPGSETVRRRRYDIDDRVAFGVPIRAHDDDWLMIWEPDPDGPLVHYIGPDLSQR